MLQAPIYYRSTCPISSATASNNLPAELVAQAGTTHGASSAESVDLGSTQVREDRPLPVRHNHHGMISIHDNSAVVNMFVLSNSRSRNSRVIVSISAGLLAAIDKYVMENKDRGVSRSSVLEEGARL
jgi:hypothetical protein